MLFRIGSKFAAADSRLNHRNDNQMTCIKNNNNTKLMTQFQNAYTQKQWTQEFNSTLKRIHQQIRELL